MRRVVVSGIGMVSPLGSNNNIIMNSLINNTNIKINQELINNTTRINKIPLIDKEIIMF
jgi:3-oxoacyl-(acyl-carrier-protein) synthase